MTLAEAIEELRVEIDDRIDTTDLTVNPPSHLTRLEPSIPASGSIDGANLLFKVKHYPILTATPISDAVQVTDQANTAFVVDEPNSDFLRGIVALTAAPTNPPSTEIRVTYFSQFFFDEQLRRFIRQGVKFIGIGRAPVADSDSLGVPEPLELPIFKFASHLAYKMLSTKTADWFPVGAGGKDADPSEVPKHYKALAEECMEEATKLRDDFYQRQGRQFAPTMAISVPSNQPPWTPTR